MRILSFLSLLCSSSVVAQITDGSFEAGTFNTALISGPGVVFIADAGSAYDGNSFGAVTVVAPSSEQLRTVMTINAGQFQPSSVYAFSFYAKAPEVNGFDRLSISVGGGGAEAPVSRVALEAPTSLTGVWMVYSYQFTIPANWNPENIARVSFHTDPISPVTQGQSYSFHLDKITLTLIGSAIPEPGTASIWFGGLSLLTGVMLRRRSRN